MTLEAAAEERERAAASRVLESQTIISGLEVTVDKFS
jgi:hypothetical protein